MPTPKIRIKVISEGADFEVWRGKELVGTCGTLKAASRLQCLINGAQAALKHLHNCTDRASAGARAGAEAFTLLKSCLNQKGGKS